MANPEHLEILKQGVDIWNKWREENPNTIPDLKEADLKKTFLEKINLQKAELTGVDLRNAKMQGADFRAATLFMAKFQGADLIDVKFQKAELPMAKFQGATLRLANFTEAMLFEANFTEADLRWANFKNAILTAASLKDAKILCIEFNNRTFCQGTDVEGCVGSHLFIKHVLDFEFINEVKAQSKWGYRFWKATSDCGRSWLLWAGWSTSLAVLFGMVFARYPVWQRLPNSLQSCLIDIAPQMAYSNPMVADGWFTPYYFSIVTFTTLGFGDITPLNLAGQIWLTLEVIFGYIMLGGLITLFATKMVRRSG